MSHPKPKKHLGQHFLTDRNILRKIVAFAGVQPGDAVVEIGPGTGSLTAELLAAGCRVLALELDAALVADLQVRFGAESRFSVVETDAVKADLVELLAAHRIAPPVRVVGNFPYNVGTGIVRHAVARRGVVSSVCALLQEEVARRMAAEADTDDYGYLTLDCRYHATVTLGFKVHPGSFSPPPRVDSRTVRLDVRNKPLLSPAAEGIYFRMIGNCFLHRRKMLLKSLTADGARPEIWREVLSASGVDPTTRPEKVDFSLWLRLAENAAQRMS